MKIRVINYGYNKLPIRNFYNDAGADVFSPKEYTIPPHTTISIPLCLGVRVPDGYMICAYPKSGLSKQGIVSQIPPIDSGYTGEINAIISNLTNEQYTVTQGQKITQLVMTPIILPEFIPEEEMDDKEARGARSISVVHGK